jgi:hypothetical protein
MAQSMGDIFTDHARRINSSLRLGDFVVNFA